MTKKLGLILGILISLSTVITILFKVDNRFAKASDVDKKIENVKQKQIQTQQVIIDLETRFEIKLLEDRASALLERIWKLEDRFYNKEMPSEVKDEYRRLKNDREQILRKIDKLTEITIKEKKENQ